MQVSTDWIEKHFHTYNRDYFGGALTPPRFIVGNARLRLGSMSHRVQKKPRGNRSSKSVRTEDTYTIMMSNYYDLPERTYQETLLHEMIHLYIAQQRIKDTSAHGEVFQRWMKEINSHGWNITVSANNDLPIAERNKNRTHVVLALQTHTSQNVFCVINWRHVMTIEKRTPWKRFCKEHAWYTTTDDYFNSYHECRTLRGRFVSAEFFAQKTKEMTPLTLPSTR